MKNLVEILFDSKTQTMESLFDSDLSTRDVHLGEVIEFEDWECSDLEDYSGIGAVLDSTFSAKLKNKLIKTPKWKKFLSPFESTYNVPFSNIEMKRQDKYINCWQLWVFTWVVMCCSSMKEIPEKLNEFMKGIKRNINDEDVIDSDLYIRSVEIFPLDGFGEMKGMPRLVVVKFKTKAREIALYMKSKKRD